MAFMAKRPKKPERRVVVSAKVSRQLLVTLQEIAAAERRSVSQIIQFLIEDYAGRYFSLDLSVRRGGPPLSGLGDPRTVPGAGVERLFSVQVAPQPRARKGRAPAKE